VELPVKSLFRTALLAIACQAFAAPAFAQDKPADPPPPPPQVDPASLDRDTLTIGGGGAYMPSYEGSNDYVVSPVLAARGKIHGISFWTRATKLFVDVVPAKSGPGWDFQLGPVAALGFNRVGRQVDPQIEALGRHKMALEAGGFIGIGRTGVITSDYDTLSARVAYFHDVSNVYGGYVITPAIDYGTPLSRKTYIGISASASYASGGYAQTYFGVDPAGSLRSGLPVFDAHKGWKDITVGLTGAYSLTGDLTHGLGLFVAGSYSRLQNDFADSPVTRIAGSPNQWTGGIGLGYTF
jgi:outer membrane scaffolding protein for murein synthesis (MipA/OmpV family)